MARPALPTGIVPASIRSVMQWLHGQWAGDADKIGFTDGSGDLVLKDAAGARTTLDVYAKADVNTKAEGNAAFVSAFMVPAPTGVEATDTANAQAQVDAAIAAGPGSAVVFPRTTGEWVLGQVAVEDATDLTIMGERSNIALSGSTARFDLQGTCDGVTIKGFHVRGDGTAASLQKLVGSSSGQTLSNITVVENVVRDCAGAVSINAESSGSIDTFEIAHNILIDIIGTGTGEGYGIHVACGTSDDMHGSIHHNWITGAHRHSIYMARGYGVDIHHNWITDHRFGVATASTLGAIQVGRSSNIDVHHNRFMGCEEVCVYVTKGSGGGTHCSNINVEHNVTTGMRSGHAIIIGGTNPDVIGYPEDVVVKHNRYFADDVVGNAIRVVCGKNVEMSDNRAVYRDAAYAGLAIAYVVYGIVESAGTSDYTDAVTVERNTAFMDTAGSNVVLSLRSEICTSGATLRFAENRALNGETMFSVGATIDGPVLYVDGQDEKGLTLASTQRVLRYPSGADDTLFVGAGDFSLVSGTPTHGAVSSIPAVLFSAGAVEEAAALVKDLPSHWQTVDIKAHITNATADAGDVRLRAEYDFFGDGDTLSRTLGTQTTVTAPAQGVVDVVTLASGVTVSADKKLAVGVTRNGLNAEDTKSGDLGLLGVELVKAS